MKIIKDKDDKTMNFVCITDDELESKKVLHAVEFYSAIEEFRNLRREIYKYDALHHHWDLNRYSKWRDENKEYLDEDEKINAYHYAISITEEEILKRMDDILSNAPYIEE
jgi:hypothetical protein